MGAEEQGSWSGQEGFMGVRSWGGGGGRTYMERRLDGILARRGQQRQGASGCGRTGRLGGEGAADREAPCWRSPALQGDSSFKHSSRRPGLYSMATFPSLEDHSESVHLGHLQLPPQPCHLSGPRQLLIGQQLCLRMSFCLSMSLPAPPRRLPAPLYVSVLLFPMPPKAPADRVPTGQPREHGVPTLGWRPRHGRRGRSGCESQAAEFGLHSAGKAAVFQPGTHSSLGRKHLFFKRFSATTELVPPRSMGRGQRRLSGSTCGPELRRRCCPLRLVSV